tara:strand:- start:9059 stop:9280 length:222 start_codon:yes stop_codon:yes gene_type:complete
MQEGNKRIQLAGKCIIHVDTGMSTSKMEIPKKSTKTGENNADSFIKEAFHFAIMRLGSEEVVKTLQNQLKNYE